MKYHSDAVNQKILSSIFMEIVTSAEKECGLKVKFPHTYANKTWHGMEE